MNSNPTNLMQASHQWASRPDDERFLTLEDLLAHVRNRREQSWTVTPQYYEVNALPDPDDPENGLGIQVYKPYTAEPVLLHPTHWGFGQLASQAKVPAGFLRKLPAELACINLQWGLENFAEREAGLFLAHTNGDESMRAVTSPSYGRIWDQQVVEAVINMNQHGLWQVPAASYSDRDPKRATTLYGSDRDVFIFLVDAETEIEVGGAKLHRGFFTWNSEVGNATFGLTTFLYDRVCDNRIIWGAQNVKEFKIKHTGGAPDRFYKEGERYLNQFASASAKQIVDVVARAQDMEVPTSRDQSVEQWLVQRGFTKDESKQSVNFAVAENGGARTLWQIVSGVTAFARSIKHTDARVTLEKKGGAILNLAE